jgi:hypothetical protein
LPVWARALPTDKLTEGEKEGRIMTLLRRSLAVALSLLILAAPFAGQSDESTPVQEAKQTPEQLQQLVAPIALYPDEMVAQVLTAATYPTQVVEADRWLQSHPDLKGKKLAKEINKQSWDSSVKALTQFPSVLANSCTHRSTEWVLFQTTNFSATIKRNGGESTFMRLSTADIASACLYVLSSSKGEIFARLE